MKERDSYYHHYVNALESRFLEEGMLLELQDYEQFLVYKKTPDNKKIPFDPNTHSYARTDDASTWSTLEQSLKALRTGRYTGIGFVFSENDNFTGIDVDNAIISGGLTEQAEQLVTQFWSYTEISPSGKGIHILVEGNIPEGRRKNGIEIYNNRRFFTITTNQPSGLPETIEYRQRELDNVYASLTAREPRREIFQPREYQVFVSDEKVLGKALNAQNGDRFTALWQGDLTRHKSHSEASFELILRLCYWANDDISQVERLYKQSALYNEKDDMPIKGMTYLQYNILQAIKKRY